MHNHNHKQKRSTDVTRNHDIGDDNFDTYKEILASFIERPWIVIGEVGKMYSRIDKPLYVLSNGTLWEHFKFNTLQRSNSLGKSYDREFKWNRNMSTYLLKRRGNFENLTLIGMTAPEMSYNQLPKNWKSIANIFDIVPNSYEVEKRHFDFVQKDQKLSSTFH